MNMYDQAALMPIINTYVPINFLELYRIAATLKADLDAANALLLSTLQKFGEFTSPSDIDTLRFYDLSIGQFDDLLDRAANDPDAMKDAAFRSQIQLRINSLDYGALSRLRQGAESLRTRINTAAEMRAKGLYKDTWDVYYDQNGNLHRFDASNYDTLNQGILDLLSPIEYKSLRDIVEPYVDGLKPRFIAGSVDPITGRSLPFTKGYMAITNEDITDILDRNVNEIMSTPQGLMWYRDIANTVKSMNPDATSEDIYQAFMSNMYDDARYKLYSSPVEDEYAMQQGLLNLKYKYAQKAAKQKEDEEKIQKIFGRDAILSQDYSELNRSLTDAVKANPIYGKELSDKYDSRFAEVSANIDNLMQKASQNSTFAQVYQLMYDRMLAMNGTVTDEMNNQLIEEAFDYALSDPNFDRTIITDFKKYKLQISLILDEEVLDANGMLMYDVIREVLLLPKGLNPFANRSKTSKHYTESLLLLGYRDAIQSVSQDVNLDVGNSLLNLMFDKQDYKENIGYLFNPQGRIISPAKFVSTNKYIQEKAKEAEFDLNLTYEADDYTELEDAISKGDLGDVAISGIKGYIDTRDGRNYIVDVKVPISKIKDKYWAIFNRVSNDDLQLNYPVTGIEAWYDVIFRNFNPDTAWKDGYVTVPMILPQNDAPISKYQSDRLFEKEYGVTSTKEAITNQSSDALSAIKGYIIDDNWF